MTGWRLGRCLPGGSAQPCHRLVVTPLRPEHQVLRDGQGTGTRGHQRHRRLAVQEATGWRRHVLVDRVVHELVAEHDPVVGLVEQLGLERVAEPPHHLSRWKACDGGDVTERHGVAEHGRDLQQLQRRLRQVPQAAHDEVAQ